ncbi:MAG: stage II sporulation protein D [Firmicutes bacterium]|nr:stage II sporulation protein D [Bacillota bacterium]
MRTYEKQIIQAGVIIVVMTLFLLVILPGTLVGIWSLGERFLDGNPGFAGDRGPGFFSDAVVEGSIDSDKVSVAVWRTKSKTVETIPLEDYVIGVVASEMPASFDLEALKAQSVAARTYGLAKVEKSKTGNPQAHPKAPLCDGTHCQAYHSEKELEDVKGSQWIKASENGFDKIRQAVRETKGQVMYYQGKMIDQPLFHSASGERTENSEDVFSAAVPYLRSVDSGQYEQGAYASETYSIGLDALVKQVRTVDGGASAEPVAVVSRSEGGRGEKFQVGGAVVTGRQIRELLGLRSANFTVQMITDSDGGKQVMFTTSGNGHGVGMSQYGADGMGKAGFDYKEILQHYYSGVEVR